MKSSHAASEELAESLLVIIRRKTGESYQYEQLCKKLGTDSSGIDAAISILASWGYKIRAKKSEGIRLISLPDALTDIGISSKLKTKFIGHIIHAYNSIKSTNDRASQMAEAGAAEGTIVVAEKQTKGRGRLGRTWHSPSGTGIYLSIVLRPKFRPEQAPGLSIMTALALAETVNIYCPGKTFIKWPNDVQIGKRKLAGILTELSADKRGINFVIVGVGINVNHGVGHFPDELKDSATSLRRVLRRKVNRVELLQSFLRQFEKEYLAYQKDGLKKAHSRIKRYSSLLGREVIIRSGRKQTNGKAVDIDSSGRLILETESGRIAIMAGEVTVVKN